MFSFSNNIELFVTLSAVAESNTLLVAANKLKLSQATVSLRLKKLQEHFEFPLFEKRGRKINILPAGLELKKTIQKSLSSFEADISKFQIQKNSASSLPIKMGARQEVFVKLSPHLKTDLSLELIAMSSLSTKNALLESLIDVAITHTRPESHEFLSVPLYTDEFVFCFSKKAIDSSETLSKSLLSKLVKNSRALNYGRSSKLLVDLLRYYKVDTKEVRSAVTVEDWGVLWNFLSNGSGFGVFPKTFVRNLEEGIEKITIPHKVLKPLTFYYIYKTEFRHNTSIKELGLLLKKAFA